MKQRLEQLRSEEYAEAHSSPEPQILSHITRETHLTMTHPRMVSGHLQGLFLTMMVEMLQPKWVLEIGTFVGYATVSIALGLPEGGMLTTIEVNDELKSCIERHLQEAEVSDKVELLMGDALEIIEGLPLEQYQLVYLDANKAQYPEYYQTLVSRLPHGALILADNTLWGGKLWHDEYHDPQTVGIRRFNDLVASDDRVTKVLLPMRDGLTMIKVK